VVPNVVWDVIGDCRPAARVRAIAAGIVLGLAVSACGTDAPTLAGPPVALERVSGDGQSAKPGEALDRPLVARLVDDDGRPVRRVEVRWSVTAGVVTPEVTTTDANGDAKTVWQLGTATGTQRATAVAEGLDPVEFVAYVDPNALPDRVALHAIALTTYDGSGQVVHPDVVLSAFAASAQAGDQPRLAITPYPWGNAAFENPSLYVGTQGDRWSVANGVSNPIVRPTSGYLSDPDIVWVEDRRELWLYYRGVTTENEILVSRSDDGVRWSSPRAVVRAPNHQAVSPTVVRRSPTDWFMWSVNSGSVGCSSASTTVELRRSSDGLAWSSPTTVSMMQNGVYPWHLEVQWIPSLRQYWALFNGKVSGSCTTDALYLATSSDGLTWRTFPSAVLRRGAIPELADIVYRATFAYDADRDLVSLWHSGARHTTRGYEWHAAFERRRRDELLDAVGRVTAAQALPAPLTPVPPLTNATAP
jgi:hypothetical protein